jgi:hypothetical protein
MKPQVAEAFAAIPPGLRPKLAALRRLILDIAAKTEGVGDLDETLKWGQPSYLTHKTKSGTTIRIGAIKGSDQLYALFVNCQTGTAGTSRPHRLRPLSRLGTRRPATGVERGGRTYKDLGHDHRP